MSANKTKLEILLDIYAGVKDGRFDLSHDPKDKWQVTIAQKTKFCHHVTRAFGTGGTVEDAAAAAAEDYYERIDVEMVVCGGPEAGMIGP